MSGTTTATASGRPARRGARRTGRVLLYLAVLFYAGWTLWPLIFTAVSSLEPSATARTGPLANYLDLLLGSSSLATSSGQSEAGSGLLAAIGHSLFIAAALVVLNLLIAGLAAYALSRHPFPGSRAFHGSVIASRIVPGIAIVGPLFVLFNSTHLFDTPWALIVSYNVFTLPLALLILKNYLDQVPRAVEEAALLDGASRWRIIWVIVAPLARPGLMATGVLVFLESWSEFFYALVFTNRLTVPPLLSAFQSAEQFNWNGLAAATVLTLVPPVALTLIFQRNVVSALAAGYER